MPNTYFAPGGADVDLGTPTDKWNKVYANEIIGTVTNHAQSVLVALGDTITAKGLPVNMYLECTTAGTTGSSELVVTNPTAGTTINDGTAVWTVRQVLPTSGGAIKYICRDVDNSVISIRGATEYAKGAYINLFGKDYIDPPDFASAIQMTSRAGSDGTSIANLLLKQSGLQYKPVSLANGAYDLGGSAIVAKSLNSDSAWYVKYASGLIIQGGLTYTTSSSYTKPFNATYTKVPVVVVNTPFQNGTTNYTVTVEAVSISGFRYHNNPAANSIPIPWIAIGC